MNKIRIKSLYEDVVIGRYILNKGVLKKISMINTNPNIFNIKLEGYGWISAIDIDYVYEDVEQR